ncbi:hypothetical protein Tco_1485341 [Tanacetum coccineum]
MFYAKLCLRGMKGHNESYLLGPRVVKEEISPRVPRGENWDLRLQLAEERHARLELAELFEDQDGYAYPGVCGLLLDLMGTLLVFVVIIGADELRLRDGVVKSKRYVIGLKRKVKRNGCNPRGLGRDGRGFDLC